MAVWAGNFNRRRPLYLSSICLLISYLEFVVCVVISPETFRFFAGTQWYIAWAGRPTMEEMTRPSPPIRFGIFEVDLQSGELRRQGFKVKLQEQPLQVLVMLLERPGEVVPREDLQRKLWPGDTFVDFERGLNRAINKLREALGDDAESPRFIETLPRRGYRFLAPVDTAGKREPEGAGARQLAIVPSDRSHQLEDTVAAAAVRRRRVLPWVVAGVVAVVAGIVSWRQWPSPATVVDRPFYQLDLDAGDEFSQPSVSPDGMRIVFVTKRGLAIRHLDQSKTTSLAGTEGASYPFFSPNGQWVAFFAAGKLQKVAVEGGAIIPLCDAPSPSGGTWGVDDTIVAALDLARGLVRVPAAGGMPQPLTDPREEPSGILMHRWPQALPGGKGVLFAAVSASGQGSLRVLAPNGTLRTVVENSKYGRFLASGYLVYYQRETLFAAPMDADRLELTGPAVPLVDAVSSSEGRADFDLSASGTLVYRRGAMRNSLPSWLYSAGKVEPALAKPGNYSSPRLSPDGKRLALSVIQAGKQSLWVYDLRRETWNRLTSEDDPELLPAWTPDGEFLAFRSGNTLAWTRSDGSGKVERLAGVSRNAGPWSFSADGKWLAFWPLQPTNSDLWIVAVERTSGVLRLGQPQPLLQDAGTKGAPAISPDGRWLAYASSKSGRFEVYVAPFSPQGAAGPNWLVSNGGGSGPVWSHTGRELFYEGPDQRVQVAAYAVTGDSFEAEKPRFWSGKQMTNIGFFPTFDVAPDGKRVLALLPADSAQPETILHVLLNVDSELRRRAPTQGR
jgi:Tol biopolymer transport system component/DNA-binding winged helix-turn-helix (wHTH) protein